MLSFLSKLPPFLLNDLPVLASFLNPEIKANLIHKTPRNKPRRLRRANANDNVENVIMGSMHVQQTTKLLVRRRQRGPLRALKPFSVAPSCSHFLYFQCRLHHHSNGTETY